MFAKVLINIKFFFLANFQKPIFILILTNLTCQVYISVQEVDGIRSLEIKDATLAGKILIL